MIFVDAAIFNVKSFDVYVSSYRVLSHFDLDVLAHCVVQNKNSNEREDKFHTIFPSILFGATRLLLVADVLLPYIVP